MSYSHAGKSKEHERKIPQSRSSHLTSCLLPGLRGCWLPTTELSENLARISCCFTLYTLMFGQHPVATSMTISHDCLNV